ncbi:hypothetical protein ACJA3G_28565, partial [Streptomyces sp. YS-3]
MRGISRRGMLGLGLGAAAAVGVAGCGGGDSSDSGKAGSGNGKGTQGPGKKPDAKLIGDGSTADTGKQPHQPPKPVPLEP